MNFGIVASTGESFLDACRDKDLDPEDIYIINSVNDVSYMLKSCEAEKITIFFADDAHDTHLSSRYIREVVNNHNKRGRG